MTEDELHIRVAQDKAHVWHPFTPMADWCAPDHQPLMITSGDGAYLIDAHGRRYLDGNASIWTNIHGHGHPAIIEAIQRQAAELAHTSSLGFATAPAAELAERICSLFPPSSLTKVFYSDDGSTAIECALRMALQYWQQTGSPERTCFAAFDQAYHGDTVAAASLGGISRFHQRISGIGVPTTRVRDLEELTSLPKDKVQSLAGVIIEPLIQGAAGMRLWPKGMLKDLRQWCDRNNVFLMLDEVMTGFGRTGTMFACQREDVVPDFVALAKGITGGTLPMAATLTTGRVFNAFLDPKHTFFYGHSYSGNPLGCAAALANLRVFEDEAVLEGLQPKILVLNELLEEWQAESPCVGAYRQCGMIAGVDINRPNGAPYHPSQQIGAKICLAARNYGLLTRPILDTLVLMPPLCITGAQLRDMVSALRQATLDT